MRGEEWIEEERSGVEERRGGVNREGEEKRGVNRGEERKGRE